MEIKDLEHGDLIFTADKTPMSYLIQNAQGDFEWSHVCSYWILDGKPTILTTGAHFDTSRLAYMYGRLDAEEYLGERKWVAGRRNDLSTIMMTRRLEALLHLEKQQTPYAVNKLLRLATWRFRSGVANKINNPPEVYPSKIFCSESEAFGIIEAKQLLIGRKQALATVNSKYPQKLEACVHTPETLFDAPETVIIK